MSKIFVVDDIGKAADERWLVPGHQAVAGDHQVSWVPGIHSNVSVMGIQVQHLNPHPSDTTVIDYVIRKNGVDTDAIVSLSANAASGFWHYGYPPPGDGMVTFSNTPTEPPWTPDPSPDVFELVVVKANPLDDGRLRAVIVVEGI